jgi:hypothetical protein
MQNSLHLVPVTKSDEITEIVLNYREMVEVVSDIRWQQLFVPQADNGLPSRVGRAPHNVDGYLIRFD